MELRIQLRSVWLQASGKADMSKRGSRILHALWMVPFAAFLEKYLYSEIYEVNKMKSFVSLIVIAACLGIPIYILLERPQDFNPLVQFLVSLLLTAASIWFGVSVNNRAARKEAAKAWLPAAETACKQLLTISATAARMRATEAQSCKSLEPLLPTGGTDCKPIKQLLEIQCRETSEKLAMLKDHIDNAVSHWEVFIGNNCDRGECEDIFTRIDTERQKLSNELATDFPAGGCGNQNAQPPA